MTKRYGALIAVDGVDFSVQPGEVVGIGGPNGAGKTTFFDLISGLTPTSEGEVYLRGARLGGLPPHKVSSMGLARTFQLNAGFDSMTLFENILVAQAFGRRSTGGVFLTSRRDREATHAVLADFDLEGMANDQVASVPVLVRKKLMVATALVGEPHVLLLDEPVGGLTPAEIDEFLELMMKLKQRKLTIIFIEHVMRFLTALADRAVIMHQGRLIYDGSPAKLDQDETVARIYLGSSGLAEVT